MTAAARKGGQTVTVREAIASGLQRRYKITAGQIVTVVDSTTSGANARAKGEATLPAPTA